MEELLTEIKFQLRSTAKVIDEIGADLNKSASNFSPQEQSEILEMVSANLLKLSDSCHLEIKNLGLGKK